MDRRKFILSLGGLIALTGAGCRRPEQKVYPSVNPVLSREYASFEYFCTVAGRYDVVLPLLVKTFEGRPIFIAPRYESSGSEKFCDEKHYPTHFFSELYNLYNPYRFYKPEKNGQHIELDTVTDMLAEYVSGGKRVVFALRASQKPTFNKLLSAITAKYPNVVFADYFLGRCIVAGAETDISPRTADCFVDFEEILNGREDEFTGASSAVLRKNVPCFRLSYYREKIRFSNMINIPKSHFLECWTDWFSGDRYYISQPVVAKLNNESLSEEELIFSLCRKLETGDCSAFESYYDYLKSKFPDDRAFETCVLEGRDLEAAEDHAIVSDYDVSKKYATTAGFILTAKDNGIISSYEDYRNPFLRELQLPKTGIAYYNMMIIGSRQAEKTGLKDGDLLEFVSGKNRLKIPVAVSDGISVKNGDTAFTDLFYGYDDNSEYSGTRLSSAFFGADNGRINDLKFGRITDGKLKQKYGSNYIDHNRLKYLKNINDVNNYSGRNKIEYVGRKYGLVVDVNKCNGCNACTVACRMENNIAVVGAENIEKGRDLDWIRLLHTSQRELKMATGRELNKSGGNAGEAFIPFMCQHCDNAPCEIACPVNASTHSPEGLNETVYNRCIGTRYCIAACQYKVRKFNFGEYYKDYPKELTAAFNPRVTVRSRGVVEKCSLCVQRINEFSAINENERLTELPQTACQEVCPAGAIRLIDINSEKFRIYIKKNSERLFNFVINSTTKPSIYYIIG